MIWGIIAALEQELALILQAMEIERRQTVFGMEYHIGKIEGKQVVAVCCSVGTINAAVCTAAMVREFGAQAVVNIGVAGNTCPDLGLLDVVLGSEVLFHDAQGDFLSNYYPFRKSFAADPGLLRLAGDAITLMRDAPFRHRIGRIATGDVFVEDPALKAEIVARHAPLCVEMEGAAIGQAAYMNGTPFLIIRSLSDDAGEEATASFHNFMETAARNSAGIVLGMLRLHGANQ